MHSRPIVTAVTQDDGDGQNDGTQNHRIHDNGVKCHGLLLNGQSRPIKFFGSGRTPACPRRDVLTYPSSAYRNQLRGHISNTLQFTNTHASENAKMQR